MAIDAQLERYCLFTSQKGVNSVKDLLAFPARCLLLKTCIQNVCLHDFKKDIFDQNNLQLFIM